MSLAPFPLGVALASWLVRFTLDQSVRVWVLAGEIVLWSWGIPLLSPPRCTNGVPVSLMVGVAMRWTSIPSRGSRKSISRLMLHKPKIIDMMSHLARMQTLPLYLYPISNFKNWGFAQRRKGSWLEFINGIKSERQYPLHHMWNFEFISQMAT